MLMEPQTKYYCITVQCSIFKNEFTAMICFRKTIAIDVIAVVTGYYLFKFLGLNNALSRVWQNLELQCDVLLSYMNARRI